MQGLQGGFNEALPARLRIYFLRDKQKLSLPVTTLPAPADIVARYPATQEIRVCSLAPPLCQTLTSRQANQIASIGTGQVCVCVRVCVCVLFKAKNLRKIGTKMGFGVSIESEENKPKSVVFMRLTKSGQ